MQKVARSRIVGVDTARGLAVFGMFVAHLGLERHSEWLSTTGWFPLADGRPSSLFAMLAGVGLVFMTRRAQNDPDQMRVQRGRILKRSLVLFLFGYALMFLMTPVAIILPSYAVLFILALPFLRLSARAVFGTAAIVFAVAPQILLLSRYAAYGDTSYHELLVFIPGLAEVWSGFYPAMTWLGYVLVGIGVGKLDLRRAQTALTMLVVGALVAAIAYGAGWWAERVVSGAPAFDLVTIAPHSNSSPEMIGNAGFAVALLGLCLLATSVPVLRIAAAPISAVGAMSLTIYSLHIVYIAILGAINGPNFLFNLSSNWPLIWLVLGSIAFAMIWQATLGQGPFERALQRLIRPKQTLPPAWRPASHHTGPPLPTPSQYGTTWQTSAPDLSPPLQQSYPRQPSQPGPGQPPHAPQPPVQGQPSHGQPFQGPPFQGTPQCEQTPHAAQPPPRNQPQHSPPPQHPPPR